MLNENNQIISSIGRQVSFRFVDNTVGHILAQLAKRDEQGTDLSGLHERIFTLRKELELKNLYYLTIFNHLYVREPKLTTQLFELVYEALSKGIKLPDAATQGSHEIDLSSSIGILVPAVTGVRYLMQAGGFANHQHVVEGFFIPINDYEGKLEKVMTDHFGPNSKYKGACMDRIDSETADFTDGMLSQYVTDSWIMVDRFKLNESHESWIHIVINPGDPSPWNFTKTKSEDSREGWAAIFVWPNSD